ncbi:MAG: ATP-binding cassette domain-containing protein [Pseudomonadota bacterium]
MLEYLSHILNLCLLFSILGLSYNLVIGYAGIFSVAHAAFFGLGAYASALLVLNTGVNFLLGFALAFVIAFIIGAVVSLPTFRIRHEYIIVFSFAFQIVIFGLMVNWIGVTGGEGGISGIPRPSLGPIALHRPMSYVPLYFIVCIGTLLVTRRLGNSPFGRVLRAIRANESAALSVGKNVVLNKVLVFGLSCGMAGIAGSLYAHYTIFVHPTDYTIHESIFFLAIVVVGGAGNPYGPILGALILTIFPEILGFIGIAERYAGPIRNILYGIMLVITMRYRPQGLLRESIRKSGRSGQEASTREIEHKQGEAAEVLPDAIKPAPMKEPSKFKNGAYLEVKSVHKSFGGIEALFDLNLELYKGKISSLIGPNGAGKTTVFNVITGFIRPNQGSVYFQNRDISSMAPFQIARMGIGRTFQDLRLFERMSVLENVMVSVPDQNGEGVGSCLFRISKVRKEERHIQEKALDILDFVRLADKADFLVENLSYPEQKMLSLARLLATGADFLLMDEPTSGVDPKSIDRILGIIRQMADHGRTICIVEHNMDVVKNISEHMIFMAQGRAIKSGPPKELLADAELARIYLGERGESSTTTN